MFDSMMMTDMDWPEVSNICHLDGDYSWSDDSIGENDIVEEDLLGRYPIPTSNTTTHDDQTSPGPRIVDYFCSPSFSPSSSMANGKIQNPKRKFSREQVNRTFSSCSNDDISFEKPTTYDNRLFRMHSYSSISSNLPPFTLFPASDSTTPQVQIQGTGANATVDKTSSASIATFSDLYSPSLADSSCQDNNNGNDSGSLPAWRVQDIADIMKDQINPVGKVQYTQLHNNINFVTSLFLLTQLNCFMPPHCATQVFERVESFT